MPDRKEEGRRGFPVRDKRRSSPTGAAGRDPKHAEDGAPDVPVSLPKDD